MNNKRIVIKLKNIIINNKLNIIILAVILLSMLGFSLYNNFFSSKEAYTVVNGYIEKVTDTIATVIKDETVIELSKTDAAMPIIEQYKRVSKDEIIAVYKNSKYTEYLNNIQDMDKQIQTLIQDLPVIYSSDLTQIDLQISYAVEQSNKANSYVKIQEYKSKIDELAYKKVLILGNLSPAGSKIRELIEKREQIEKESKSIADNIKSPVAGAVSYKVDKLENIANIANILKYTISDFENIIEAYNKDNINNFGIKIVDNYKSYFLIKEKRGENDKYIKEGNMYNIRFNDKVGYSFSGKLIKNLQNEEYNYIIFEISNGIENIIDSRKISVEVIWKKYEDMAVPAIAIKKNIEKNYEYVTIITGSEYIDVPIKIIASTDDIYIVQNYTSEELASIGLTIKGKLELYDQIVIKK